MKPDSINSVWRISSFLGCLILCFACWKDLDSDSFFNFPISEINDIQNEVHINVPYVGSPGGKLRDGVIKDNYLFSYSGRNEHVYSVSTIDSGELVCQFIKRGRAWNEPLNVLPIWDLYEDNGETKGLLYSFFDSKLFICNITASLSSGHDTYDRIVKLDSGRDGIIKILTFYNVNDSTMIAYNTNESGSVNHMEEPPIFELYNTHTGNLFKQYSLFNRISFKSKDEEYTSKNYLYNYSDIKTDGTKLVFCMANMPQYNILNTSTGDAKGFRIKRYKDFTAKKPVKHFSSVQCDDKFIYALYSDKKFPTRDNADILYVFDWNGNIKYKYRLDRSFSDLYLDGQKLYFSNEQFDELYGLPTDSITRVCFR